ncbi:unnamed protein product [Malus baccata var. baccata]
MAINRDSTPPPMIGKIGPYTVFMTPPSTPKPPEPVFESPRKVAAPVFESPKKVAPPPVQPPPQQLVKPIAVSSDSSADGSVLGIFKNAVTKVQKGRCMFLFTYDFDMKLMKRKKAQKKFCCELLSKWCK